MQKVICTGRVTRDLELRYMQDNKPITTIPIAVINSNKEAKPLYLDFIAYGDSAKAHCQYLGKGSTIYVEGHIYQSIKENAEGKKTKLDRYYVDRIEYLGMKKVSKTEGEQVLSEIQNQTSGQQIGQQLDPFKDFGEEIQLSDNDLPF